MKNLFLLSLTLFALLVSPIYLSGQDEEEEIPEGWTVGAGLGLDFAQLLQINPRQGAGQNRLGFGGALNAFGTRKKGRSLWESTGSWQFALQRLGSGTFAEGADSRIPFQKSIDELRLNSKYGVQASDAGKLYWAANFTFLSQVTPAYQYTGEGAPAGNFITDFLDQDIVPLSQFLSPATITFSLGADWKPNDNWSFFYSPAGIKMIVVANDDIAVQGVHGNPVERDEAGVVTSFDNTDFQVGSIAQVGYKASFAGEKGSFTSNLQLYSNYLRNPQNIDVDWNSSLNYELLKNLNLTLLLNVFYDDDVLVQITDYDFPNGVNGLGNRVNVAQQLLLTYAVTF
ncbi:MAG: DUF3078 domain-containing protein [Bacteroidota bacterium]